MFSMIGSPMDPGLPKESFLLEFQVPDVLTSFQEASFHLSCKSGLPTFPGMDHEPDLFLPVKVAIKNRWQFLVVFSALCTAITLLIWTISTFVPLVAVVRTPACSPGISIAYGAVTFHALPGMRWKIDCYRIPQFQHTRQFFASFSHQSSYFGVGYAHSFRIPCWFLTLLALLASMVWAALNRLKNERFTKSMIIPEGKSE